MYYSESGKKQRTTLTFNFDMTEVEKAGFTTDELLEDMRRYAKECDIKETAYGVFVKEGEHALAMLYGYVVRKEDEEPDFIHYLTSWIADVGGNQEDCKASILKYRLKEKEEKNGKNEKY